MTTDAPPSTSSLGHPAAAPNAASFLAALQLSDSMLPIGRFAHSGGLEALLRHDPEAGEDAILDLVATVVVQSVGPLDGVAVAKAHRVAIGGNVHALVELDIRVTARKLTPGSRLASTVCGRRLAALVPLLTDRQPVGSYAALVADGGADGNLAVVEGALLAALGVGCDEAVLVEIRSQAATLLSAAVRLGRLSSARAQSALRLLEPSLIEAASLATCLSIDELRSVAPELEIHAMAHARADARLFAT